MITKNIYGYLHGGSSFSILDTLAGQKARECIGDSMTSSAHISFFRPILMEEIDLFQKEIHILSQSTSTITLQWYLKKNDEVYVSATFTFVKLKK